MSEEMSRNRIAPPRHRRRARGLRRALGLLRLARAARLDAGPHPEDPLRARAVRASGPTSASGSPRSAAASTCCAATSASTASRRRRPRWASSSARSCSLTGPIWAKGTWGRWWTWDLRLTLTLLLYLIYVSYLLLRSFTEGSERAARFSAVFAILGLLVIPLNYFAIDLAGGRTRPPREPRAGQPRGRDGRALRARNAHRGRGLRAPPRETTRGRRAARDARPARGGSRAERSVSYAVATYALVIARCWPTWAGSRAAPGGSSASFGLARRQIAVDSRGSTGV